MTETPPHRILALLAGFLVWSGAFVLLYALQALGCRFGWNEMALGPLDLHRAVLIGVFGLVVIAQIAVLRVTRPAAPGPDPAPFLARAGHWASLAALVAAILVFAPVVAVSTCL